MQYANDSDFSANIRLIPALAFIPIDKVIPAFDAVVSIKFWTDEENNSFNEEKQHFLNYFESNYIGTLGRTQNHRRAPRFPIGMWNMFQITANGNYIQNPISLLRK